MLRSLCETFDGYSVLCTVVSYSVLCTVVRILTEERLFIKFNLVRLLFLLWKRVWLNIIK